MTPVERVEQLYDELLEHYAEGSDAEIRAAAKLLLVALDRFRSFGGPNWRSLVDEYMEIAERDPAKFERIMRGNRGTEEDLTGLPDLH